MVPLQASERLHQQVAFILEIDKLKQILRQTRLTDGSRQENSAEHSWHLAVMAIALAEYAPTPLDLLRVIQMLVLHDIVEIDAGDTFAFDQSGYSDKVEREQRAAERLFGLLPEDQQQIFRQLWDEFEAGHTGDAQFARALDCLQPLLHNCQNGGGTWKSHNIHHGQVLKRMQSVKLGMPALWAAVEQLLADAIACGYLQPAPRDTALLTDEAWPES